MLIYGTEFFRYIMHYITYVEYVKWGFFWTSLIIGLKAKVRYLYHDRKCSEGNKWLERCICYCMSVCVCICVWVYVPCVCCVFACVHIYIVCLCVCVCGWVVVGWLSLCLFPFTVKDFTWLNKTINVMPEIRSAMFCRGNTSASRTFVATS